GTGRDPRHVGPVPLSVDPVVLILPGEGIHSSKDLAAQVRMSRVDPCIQHGEYYTLTGRLAGAIPDDPPRRRRADGAQPPLPGVDKGLRCSRLGRPGTG